METGYVPFQQQPVYIGYGPSGVGTMTLIPDVPHFLLGAKELIARAVNR